MNEDEKIILGLTYLDPITNRTGVATGRAVYLHRAPEACLEFPNDDNGRPVGCEWFPEVRLKLVDPESSE